MSTDSPYAKTQEFGGTIRAKRAGGMLAIPIEDNLTPAGVPRYLSPLDHAIADGFFLKSGAFRKSLYYVRRTNKISRRKKTYQQEIRNLEFLFMLRKEVEIPGPKSGRRKMPSRLGMIDTATNERARKRLRFRLVKGTVRALATAFGQKKGGA
jgi:hypothetical protein